MNPRVIAVVFAGVAASFAALMPAQVDYRLRFAPDEHDPLWYVEVRFRGSGDDTIDFWIPRWTPGAYHLADYGRFVRTLAATDAKGNALAVERDGPAHFVIHGAAAAAHVVLRYEAASASRATYADRIIDVEANRITPDYAYVNPASLFGFVPARLDEPIALTVELPPRWQAATVLERRDDGRYVAPSYYRLEDSPLLFAEDLATANFELDGVPHAVTAYGRDADEVAELAAGCKRIATAAASLMQGLPYDRYHFLFGFVNSGGASGLEHSFSTLILVDADAATDLNARGFWRVVAHEYFHLWCAERIHVDALERPDYTKPFATGTLWLNEGVTEYMAHHLLLHGGFTAEADLLNDLLAGAAVPVSRGTWTAVSRAATEWRSPADLMQFALRMYHVGPRTILGLDLAMRRTSGGQRGVVDLLRFLRWACAEHGRGFGEDDLPALIDGVATGNLAEFYRRYIDGPESPDVAALLDVIGYRFDAGKAVAIESASAVQLAARRDFFASDGRP